jgi:hypothetical protein
MAYSVMVQFESVGATEKIWAPTSGIDADSVQ